MLRLLQILTLCCLVVLTSCRSNTTVPDITITIDPSTLSIMQGSSNTVELSLSRSGDANASASVDLIGLPSGVTIEPVSIAAGQNKATVRLRASSSATPGSSNLRLTITSGAIVRETALALTIVARPDFAINLASSSLSLIQGQKNLAFVVDISRKNLTALLDVSVAGLPNGVSAPTVTLAGNQSQATLAFSATDSAMLVNDLPLTLRVGNANIEREASIKLTVTAKPDFSFALRPESLSLFVGKSAEIQATLVRSSAASGPITISAKDVPVGLEIMPVVVPGGQSSAKIVIRSLATSAASAVTALASSTKTIIFEASNGSVSKSASLALTVSDQPGFNISASTPVVVKPGQSSSVTLTISRDSGFTAAVTATWPVLPSGVSSAVGSALFSGATLSVNVSFNTSASAAIDPPVQIEVLAKGADLERKTNFVMQIAPDFSLADIASLSLQRGQSKRLDLLVMRNSQLTGDIALAFENLPDGVSIEPALIAAGQSQVALTVRASANAAVRSNSVTVRASSAGISKSQPFNLTVLPLPDFSLVVAPKTLNVGLASSGVYSVSVIKNQSFSGDVTVTLTGLPANVEASPSSLLFKDNETSKNVTITTTNASQLGKTTTLFSASGGGITKSESSDLVISNLVGFTISATSPVLATPGQSAQVTLKVLRDVGFSEAISAQLQNLPSGVTVAGVNSFVFSGNTSSLLVTLNISNDAAIEPPKLINVVAEAAGLARSTNFSVQLAPNFSLADLANLTVQRNQSTPFTVTVQRNAQLSADIALSFENLPAGVTITPNSASLINLSSSANFIIMVANGALLDTSAITVKAVAGTLTKSKNFNLTVNPVPDFALAVTPKPLTINKPISGSNSGIYTVNIARNASMAADISVNISGLPAGTSASPASLSFSGNESSKTFTISVETTAALATSAIGFSATGAGVNKSESSELVISNTPAFSITALPSPINVVPGNSALVTLSIVRDQGFIADVTAMLQNLPNGVSVAGGNNISFSGATTTIPVMLNTSANADIDPAKIITVNASASNGAISRNTTFVLQATADFTLNDLSNLTIQRNQSAPLTVSLLRNAQFSGDVALSFENLPSGVTISPNSITLSHPNSSSNFTVLVGANAALTTSAITVRAIAGNLNKSKSFNLTVNPLPDFSLAVTPKPLTINKPITGTNTGTYMVNITRNATMTADITVTPTGLPAGTSAMPASLTFSGATTSQSFTITATTSVALGTTTTSFSAVSVLLSKTDTADLVMSNTPAYTISASSPVLVTPGQNALVTLSIVRDPGFVAPVTASLATLPGGVAVVGSNSFSFTGATLTQVVTLATTAGAAVEPPIAVTVNALGDGIARSSSFSLQLAPDFVLNTPANLTIQRNQNAPLMVSIGRNSQFSGSVNLSFENLPSGVSITPNSFTLNHPNSSTNFTVTIGNSAALTTTAITLRAISGGLNKSVSFNLTVTPVPDFSLTVTPKPLTINKPMSGTNTGTYTVNITRNATMTADISVTLTGLPAGTSAMPASLTFSGATTSQSFTVTATTSVALGTTTTSFSAISGLLSKTDTADLVVSNTPAYTISATSPVLVTPGQNAQFTLNIVRDPGFVATVTATLANLPSGVTVMGGNSISFAGATLSQVVTLNTTLAAAVEPPVLVTVNASGNAIARSSSFSLQLTPDFVLNTPSDLTIQRTQSGMLTVSIVRNGQLTGNVALSFENLPAGVTITPNSFSLINPSSSNSFSVAVSNSAAAATTAITVRAISGLLNKTKSFNLTVTPIPDFSLSVSPKPLTILRPMSGSNSGIYTVTITRLAGLMAPITVDISGLPAGASASVPMLTFSGATLSQDFTITVTPLAAAATTTTSFVAKSAGLTDKTDTAGLTISDMVVANTAPVITAPLSVTRTGTLASSSVSFSGGNLMSVADSPTTALYKVTLVLSETGADPNIIEISLGGVGGSLTLGSMAGLTFGSNTSLVKVFWGSLTSINAALNGLSYSTDSGIGARLDITVADTANSDGSLGMDAFSANTSVAILAP
jgi:hypothetical protein